MHIKKMSICKLTDYAFAKCKFAFANCKLQTTNLNPVNMKTLLISEKLMSDSLGTFTVI